MTFFEKATYFLPLPTCCWRTAPTPTLEASVEIEMQVSGEGGDSGEGFSFWCPAEGHRLASLARLEHGVERLEKKRTAREEADVIVYPP